VSYIERLKIVNGYKNVYIKFCYWQESCTIQIYSMWISETTLEIHDIIIRVIIAHFLKSKEKIIDHIQNI
jgi:hypothetical protein